MFSNKPYVAQHHNGKQNADFAYYGLYDQNKIQNLQSLFNKLSENIYFIGVTIMVCTQFHLERKRQFSFRDTLRLVVELVLRI